MDGKTGEHHAPTAFLLGTTPALLVMFILSTLLLSGITIVLRETFARKKFNGGGSLCFCLGLLLCPYTGYFHVL